MTRIDYWHSPQAPRANTILPAASAIVINNKGELLLHRRSDNDLWALPGGTMDIGESIKETVIREVKEETGLEVKPEYLVGIYTDPGHVIVFSDGEVRQEFSVCFFCTIVGGELRVSKESLEVAFISMQELESLRMHPSIRLRIQHYLEHHPYPIIR